MAKTRASKEEVEERLKLLEEEGLKFCPNCQLTKDASEFAEDKRHYDGLQTYCRDCCNLLRRTKYGEKVRATAREYHYEHKEENNARVLKDYYENQEHYQELAREWRANNVEHRRKYRKQYHQEHYEEENAQARERMAAWWRENPERHKENCRRREMRKKEAGGEHQLGQWREMLEMCRNECMACGSTEDLTHDHIIPIAWGGTDDIDNIQVLCLSCNCTKQDHYAADYRPIHIRAWAFLQSQESDDL